MSYCDKCKRRECACEILEEISLARAREFEAIKEAEKYRQLWSAAASLISYASKNKKLPSPRGEDERRIIDIAKQANHAMFWSGGTDGWLSDDLRGY